MRKLPDEVESRLSYEPTTGCWLWLGMQSVLGYGYVWRRGFPRKTARQLAHRYVYELAHGAIPDGLELDHLCRTPACVNPDHLEPVTHLENVRRGRAGDHNKGPGKRWGRHACAST